MTRGGMSLEKEEETMEEEANEERTSVGIGGGGSLVGSFFVLSFASRRESRGEWRSGRWCRRT